MFLKNLVFIKQCLTMASTKLIKKNNNGYKTSIIAELVLSPRTSTSVSISSALKEVLNILHSIPDIKTQTHAMGTNIECHDLDTLFNAVKVCHNYLITQGYPRVVTELKIDERTDLPTRTMQDNVDAVL